MSRPVRLTLRRQRLRALATWLETRVPVARFRMDTQGRHPGVHPPAARHYCGTVGCALGWAAAKPAFQRAGLRWQWEQVRGGWLGVVYFGRSAYLDAARHFFGLRFREAYLLFGAHADRTRAAECRLLRQAALGPFGEED